MIIGTAYFPTVNAARRYYKQQGIDLTTVKEMLAAGDIHVGKPPIKPGDKLTLIDNRTRYAIEESGT